MIKKSYNGVAAILLVVFMAFCLFSLLSVGVSPRYMLAEELGDSIGSSGEGVISEDDLGMADFIRKHRSMTNEQLQVASQTVSPLTNMIGYLIGGVVVLTAFGIFLITALDLAYIGFPPIRKLLYPAGAQQAQQGGAMPGMGMGMGMGSGMQGGQPASTRQLISDEAVACAALMGGGQQQQSGGMGSGYGMSGGYGQAGGQQQQQMSTKSVITTYFTKRIVFMVMFGLCIVVLLSSALLGTGANLALWFLKLINTLNGYIPS